MRTLAILVLLGYLACCIDWQAKPLSKQEIVGAAAKCKTKLTYQPKLKLPENWLAKDEKYVHAPVVWFFIMEDGTVRDVKLKRRTGAKKLDEYILGYVNQWKYKPMPGCEGVENTMSITIDFD